MKIVVAGYGPVGQAVHHALEQLPSEQDVFIMILQRVSTIIEMNRSILLMRLLFVLRHLLFLTVSATRLTLQQCSTSITH